MCSITESELNMAAILCEQLEEMGAFNGACYEEIEEAFPNIDTNSGCTRKCFMMEELPGWVIKVCFSDMKFDYCKREVENYKAAVEAGLEFYFASTYKVYECADGRWVTVQEELDVNEEAISDSLYNHMRSSMDPDDYENEDDFNSSIWDTIVDMSDEERVEILVGYDEELMDFICDHHINDLHEGNWGRAGNNDLVIMDFAGYGF